MSHALRRLGETLSVEASVGADVRDLPLHCGGAYITLTGEHHTFLVGAMATTEQQQRLAATLLGTDLNDADAISADDTDDAFGELVNILVGQVKVEIGEAEPDLELGLPLLTHGAINSRRALSTWARQATLNGIELVLVALRFPLGPEAARRRVEVAKRQRVEEELRLTQRLEAVGQLAAGIAHEINTPMQFIGDNVAFMRDSVADLQRLLEAYSRLREAVADDERHRDLVDQIATVERDADLPFVYEELPTALAHTQEGVQRVAGIVRAMRELGRRDGSEKTPSDLNRVVTNALTVARGEYASVADVDIQLSELPLVSCRPSEISQVVLNLILNAAHSITEAFARDHARGRLLVRSYVHKDGVVLDVGDTGPGIPEALRDRVFEPFFTTKEVGRGTGQGLALARTIVVDRHQGTLHFDTETGKGTTFHLWLPLEAAS